MSIDLKVDVKRSDFKEYEDYVKAFEKERQKEIARRAKMTPQEIEKEEEKLEGEYRARYSNYVNDFARAKAVAEGLSPTGEVVKITPEQAMSNEAHTGLGKKATEDKKKAASNRDKE